MRKRRRLADKLTILVCVVLVAFSAFFYVPMDVEASSYSNVVVFDTNVNDINNYHYTNAVTGSKGMNFITSEYDSEEFYFFKVRFDINVSTDINLMLIRNFSLRYADRYLLVIPAFEDSHTMSFDESREVTFVSKGSWLKNNGLVYDFRVLNGSSLRENVNIDVIVDYEILDSYVLTGAESGSYQQGYNAGYSAGEEVGESNGYSSGYSDGYEAGEQSGYDSGFEAGEQSGYESGFQAGQDSVDTQSYYDAGYSAGYDAGYLSGYDDGFDDGYDAGWQAYEDKISGWGADTSDYPVYITSDSSESGFLSGYVYGNSQVYDEQSIVLNFDINPNHIYRFDVKLGYPRKDSYSNTYGFYTAVYFCAGGVDYFIPATVNLEQGVYESIYVRGDMLSSSFSKKGVVNVVSSSVTDPGMPASFSFSGFGHDVQVYDVGPIGNMQNHIANQTDQLTGGFNDSQGNSVNNDFSSGLNEFETAEDSLFATATTGMKDFTFFDISSVPAMVTGMSFVGSIMSGWFTQAGGASGVGIVLSILFSIMLVAMVLGLYRWYQSKGGKD